jgi:isoleucyl-tRNA synthetase
MDSKEELEILEFWKKEKIYRKALQKRKGAAKFYMCDGPPYPTGEIHAGTAWNKSLKDAICRYQMLTGKDVYIRAGYDTHGLPIELQVEKKLGLKGKKDIEELGIKKFVHACKEWAVKYIGVMNEQFESLGVWMDFEDPYMTFTPDYIDRAWKVFRKAHDMKLLKNDYYVIAQCPRCQTSLANYELEYADDVDPSIYVKFKVDGEENEWLVIWTTTPWTLVGNMAVMAHPMYRYVKVKVGEEVWIVAKERLNTVLNDVGASGTVIGEIAGKDLKEIKYVHPLAEEVPKQQYPHPVVLTDEFVTLEEGTGLVHCAPAHGPEDFIVGQRNEILMFSSVEPSGKYNGEAGELEGMDIFKANEKVIELLKEKGTLLAAGKVTHRYPHCWRCKTKLIYTPSRQWFIAVTKLKKRFLEENAKVNWIPPFAGVWFQNFLENIHDWCISRQRYWGIPLPIWKCEKCDEMKVLGSLAELGKDVDPHRPDIDEITFKCEKCNGNMYRVPDILDVWFDSGNAIWAGLRPGEEKYYPSDMILEGKDQIRGWFYTSLGAGMIANDEVPYKAVLMHGYVVDEKGMAMHKSLGNYVEWGEVAKKFPMDTFRFWCLGNVTWEDLKFSWKELEGAHRDLLILRNVATYLERFYKKGAPVQETMEDVWLRSRINTVIKECTERMEAGEVHTAARILRRFFVDDLSRFYLKLVKKREDLSVLHDSFMKFLVISTPFIPFTTEAIYKRIYEKEKNEESISLLEWPKLDSGAMDPLLEKQVEIVRDIGETCNALRAEKGVKGRWPLSEVLIVTKSTEVAEGVKRLNEMLARLANVKVVSLGEAEIKLKAEAKKILGAETFEKLEALKQSDEAAFLRGRAMIGDKEVEFSEYISVSKTGYAAKVIPWGAVLLKTHIDKKLWAEGMLSEIRRRIQMSRKELKLVESNSIDVHLTLSKELEETIKEGLEQLKKEVNARDIKFGTGGKHRKAWEIEEEKVGIGIDVI